jgi:hypothetical protein
MIDWTSLAWNGLWVVACMLALSVVAIQQWEARASGTRLRDGLKRRGPATVLCMAAVFFCVGILGTSSTLIERIAWGVLGLLFGVQGWLALRYSAAAPNNKPTV